MRQRWVKAEFASADEVIQRRIAYPANLLIATAGANLLLMVGFFCWDVVRVLLSLNHTRPVAWPVFVGTHLLLLFLAIREVLILLAALEMKRGRSRSFALFGCVMALLPLTPLALLSIPAGVWGLLVLQRPEGETVAR